MASASLPWKQNRQKLQIKLINRMNNYNTEENGRSNLCSVHSVNTTHSWTDRTRLIRIYFTKGP